MANGFRFTCIFLRALLLLPYFVSVLLADLIGGLLRRFARTRPRYPAPESLRPGITVIIPERDNVYLLGDCLRSLSAAVAAVAEPVEVIVVVSGSDPLQYDRVRGFFPSARWIFVAHPLTFSQAIAEGLETARYDWVYLLNNDMTLDPAALSEVMKWRAPHIFAIASQIHFADGERRREETGWTDFRIWDGLIRIFDALPENRITVRGNFYAGGGSSLFQKALLLEFVRDGDPYRPFYWEDVEWGTRAWKKGYEVLFCPTSMAWHIHRATVAKFYRPAEVERIFRRNALLYQLRNGPGLGSTVQLFSALARGDWRTFREVFRPAAALGALAARLTGFLQPFDNTCLPDCAGKHYSVPHQRLALKPVILVASPYVAYPPAHGGAVRMDRLWRKLAETFHVILLSDEREAYSPASHKYFEPFASIHLAGGRREKPAGVGNRIARIVSHSHGRMAQHLERLIECYRPALVDIEFIELAGLVRRRRPSVPWILSLHDVLLSSEQSSTRQDCFELDLIRRFDAAVVCSPEDASLLKNIAVSIIPNGLDYDRRAYLPSPPANRILFMGTFRYRPNLDGIRLFLEEVYPSLAKTVPDLELWLLGGHQAPEIAAGIPCFAQAGVKIFDYVERPRNILDLCALTINPIRNIRGSSIKNLESLAAGRICVSTHDGARGFLDAPIPSLIVADIEDFAPALERLLLNPGYRHSIEWPSCGALEPYDWSVSAQKLSQLVQELIRGERAPAPERNAAANLPRCPSQPAWKAQRWRRTS